jgi:hypothetical protein
MVGDQIALIYKRLGRQAQGGPVSYLGPGVAHKHVHQPSHHTSCRVVDPDQNPNSFTCSD